MFNLKTTWKYFIIGLILTYVVGYTLAQTIVDTHLANLTPAQKAWLVNNTDLARELYLNELAKSSSKTVPAYNLAFLTFCENDFESAQRFLEIALKQNPQYGPALLLKARIHSLKNEVKPALDYFNEALKYHFQPYLPAYYRGLFYQSRGVDKRAINDFKQAIDQNDKFSPAYAPLAQLLIKQGAYDQARAVLEKGLTTSYDAEILLGLAIYFDRTNDRSKAAYYYHLFAELFPRHPETNRALSRLEQLDTQTSSAIAFTRPKGNYEVLDFIIGENQVYNVHWGPIKVGELNTIIAEKLTFNGKPAYKVIFSLDSNPALEFIASLHSDYITIVDAASKQVMQHYLHVRENKLVYEKVYDFHRESNKFICRIVNEDGSLDLLEKWLPENTIDGTSILFYSRQVVKNQASERILTIIDENFVVSDIFYEHKREPVMVRGKYEPGILISGENHYKGIVGFTGKFRGWFRDAPTFLPIQADFEIWVGRILITIASEKEQREHAYAR